MFKFIRRSTDFVQLANSLGKLAKIIRKIESGQNILHHNKYALLCVYIIKTRIKPIIEEHGYTNNMLIIVEELYPGKITLGNAINSTIGKIEVYVEVNKIQNEYSEIMNEGNLFREIRDDFTEKQIDNI
jgi:hypothetical protein